MSAYGVLNRADHNNKGSIQYDHGTGLYPLGKYILTTYQSVARIKELIKFSFGTASGRLCVVELQDFLYPPQDPTPFGIYTSPTGRPDKISIDGTNIADGEHDIIVLDEIPRNQKRFIFLDNINPANLTEENIEAEDVGWLYFSPHSKGDTEILMDPSRVMSHPSFPQREGEGIYTYPYPPDITRNFIYHPATKVDGAIQKTVSSSVLVAQPQVDEDVVISEVWLGGNRELSTLSEMFRVFHKYWTTLPEPGAVLGWEPRDRSFDRFGIQIARVQLGGIDYEYREVREFVERNKDSFLDSQLTLQFKLAKRTTPPRPQISMEGR